MEQPDDMAAMEPLIAAQAGRPLHQIHQEQPEHFEVVMELMKKCRYTITSKRGDSSDVEQACLVKCSSSSPCSF